ncbi:MAG: hypothetical protein KDJ15_04910 [Alphaproteobacteria bacterium]|nr:hypothetical protein [Alphaproteobacteria bacterium]
MMLPPILANTPIAKLLQSSPANEAPSRPATPASGPAEDTVEISNAAKARLAESRKLNEPEARETAAKTREQLEENRRVSLSEKQNR